MEVYKKTYGIKEIIHKGKKRYLVVCDGRSTLNLHYAKPDFALKKAKAFCRRCHQDYTRSDGSKVCFTFAHVK